MNVVVFVPTFIQLFLSFGMDLIWGYLLMMQVACNMRNFQSIILPAAADLALQFVDSVVNFKLTEQVFFKEHISPLMSSSLKWVSENVGFMPVAIGGFFIFILLVVILSKLA